MSAAFDLVGDTSQAREHAEDEEDVDDALAFFADEELAPEVTCARIEALAVAHVRSVLGAQLDPGGAEGGERAGGSGQCPSAELDMRTSATARVRLHDTRRPDEYARLWRVLDALHVHLSESRTVTQRGLYYLLSSSDKDLFPNPGVVNTCLRECVGLLRCSRHAMGITTSSRGQVAGRLHVRGPDGVWKDCAAPGGGYYVIPGDVGILRRVELRCDARYVIIVEKDSVFDKLVRERVFDRLPCVIVTAKGFPDLATRAFLRRIQDSFPVLPILAFVDWNPSGILILQTYRSTSRSAALEASRYALDVKWLGIRSGDLGELSSASRLPLTDLDRAKIRNLLLAAGVSADDIERGGGGGGSSGSFQTTFDLGEGDLGESERRRRVLISELRDMLNSGTKAEIESLYPVAAERGEFFLAEFIIEKILRADYV